MCQALLLAIAVVWLLSNWTWVVAAVVAGLLIAWLWQSFAGKNGRAEQQSHAGFQWSEAYTAYHTDTQHQRPFNMSELVADVTSQAFNAVVLQAEGPVLVHFWAPWCGPCRALNPHIEAVAQRLKHQLKVVRINTDKAQNIAIDYGIMSAPALLLFENGRVVDRMIGAGLGTEEIARRVKTHLQNPKKERATRENRQHEHDNRRTGTDERQKSAYEVLGLTPGATMSAIKAAYHRQAQLNHPDKVASLAPEFQELAKRRMTEINLAYEELKQQVGCYS
jgi:thioredoxin 1